MKNLSFTEFIKDLEKQNEGATETEVVKVETYYLDDDDNIVEPEKATKGIIRELDEDGNLVRETFGTFEERKEISDEELTRMTQEFLKRH